MDSLLLWIDGYLIQLYRMTGDPLADYFIGTLVLAVLSVAVGELTMGILGRMNRAHIQRLEGELAQKHEQSIESKRSGDEAGYQSLNREANDAFARVFFNMFTFSAASLWSVFMALAWMQTRFMNIEFPLPFALPVFGGSVGYVFTFLLLYILARVCMGGLRRGKARIAS